jgi:hypothetical protein
MPYLSVSSLQISSAYIIPLARSIIAIIEINRFMIIVVNGLL